MNDKPRTISSTKQKHCQALQNKEMTDIIGLGIVKILEIAHS